VKYDVSLKGSARKEFMRLPGAARASIADRLDALAGEPRPRGAEALAGQLKGLLRPRVGDYRVVYEVDDSERTIIVTRVRHCSKAYR
jgi:mRNA interferase RelE/StbE